MDANQFVSKLNISHRHDTAKKIIDKSLSNVMKPLDIDSSFDDIIGRHSDDHIKKTNQALSEISDDLDDLLNNI